MTTFSAFGLTFFTGRLLASSVNGAAAVYIAVICSAIFLCSVSYVIIIEIRKAFYNAQM